MVDVTESRRDAALSSAVNKTQAVIEFSMDGTIIHANENFCQTLGYTLAEIKGQHHRMFCESAYTSSPEYPAFWAKLNRGEYDAGEYKRLGKGGKEIWIQASYNPVFDPNGRPVKVIKCATDMTSGKLKNADYEGQLNAINKAQAVIEFNLDGTIRFANENFLATLGYSLDEVKGKHHSMFVDPAYGSSVEYRTFWEDLRAGKFQAAQYKRFGKGGKEVWIQASYNPIFDLNGKPFKVVKYASDITQAKKMEFEIAEAQKRDARVASEMQQKVNEILVVAEKAAQRDYSTQLSVRGEDTIGKLGEGLAKFFKDKQRVEQMDAERADKERQHAEEQQRKVAIVLKQVNMMADGDFSGEVPDLGDDAIGQVGSGLRQALKSMNSALGEVKNVAETVSSAASQLAGASREIASGAQSQASSLEETASSLEEITSTVKQNSDNAQQARQLANGSRDVANVVAAWLTTQSRR